MIAKITKTDNKIKKVGVKIFPILSITLPGFKAKAKTARKNINEKINKNNFILSSEIFGAIPTSKATVDVLGIAKNGPIVKYKAVVKKYANLSFTVFPISNKLSFFEIALATTPKIGSPTPLIINPKTTL